MRAQLLSRALSAGLTFLFAASIGLAQELKLPEGLKHVPPDAIGFVHVRVGDLLKNDLGKTLLQEIRKDREASKGLKQIEGTLGITADDLESVTLLLLAAPRDSLGVGGGGFGPGFRPHFHPGGREGVKPIFEDKKFDDKKLEKELEKKEAEERRRLDERFEQLKRELEESKRKLDDAKRLQDEVLERLKVNPPMYRFKESPLLFQDEEAKRREQEARARELLERELRMRQIQEEIEFQRVQAKKRMREHPHHIHDHDFDDFAPSAPLVILTSTKALDRKKILREQLFRPALHGSFAPSPLEDRSLLFLSDRSVLIGTPWQLASYSEMAAQKSKLEPLKSALALGLDPNLVVAGGHVPADLRRVFFSPFMPEARVLAPLAPLFQTEAGMTLNLDKSVTLRFQFNAPTEQNAEQALQAVKSLRVLGELAIDKAREHGESGGAKLELEKALLKGLADATIERKKNTVHAEIKLELGPAFYKKFMKDIVAQFRSRGDRTRSVNNLKQVGIALHAYHDTYRRFPAAGIGDRDGKPLLSWRVAILPFIEQDNLYKQFDLNQPWDHPTNKALIAKMPAVYMIPGADTKEGETNYRVLVGGSAMFEARMGTRLADVLDGLSNTFMVVEARDSTIWTKPDDLPYDPKAPLPKFGIAPDGFNVLMGDGSVRFIRATTPEDVLRAYITRNGGEVLPLD
jgi:hypothetical protein